MTKPDKQDAASAAGPALGLRPPKSRGIAQALWSLAQPPAFDARPPHVEAARFRAAPRRGVAPLIDVYLPNGAGPHASVLIIHGGGFVVGSRRMKPVRYLAKRLCEAGIAAAALDYRMIFRGGRLEEALSDVAAASAWWREASDRFGLDRQRISVAGFSAGATLALLHAAAAPDPYHRLVSFFGVYDFAYLNGHLAVLMRRLLLRSADPGRWAALSPLARCTTPTPTLLIHGTADSLVPLEHAHRLQARRQALGLPTRLCEYEGAPHGFLNDATLPATSAAAAATIEFVSG